MLLIICQHSPTVWRIFVQHTCMSGQYFHWGCPFDMCILLCSCFVGVNCACILTWCKRLCVRRLEDGNSYVCVCLLVWGKEAQLCSLIFWEQQGGVVDPPAPFSLQLDLVGFQQLHPFTKHLFVIFPRRYKLQLQPGEERGRRGEDGQSRQKGKGRWLFSVVCARSDMGIKLNLCIQ